MNSNNKLNLAPMFFTVFIALTTAVGASAHEVSKNNSGKHDGRGNGSGKSHGGTGGGSAPDLLVTYAPQDAKGSDNIVPSGELLTDIFPDGEIERLHSASKYRTVPLERHLLPPYYYPPRMDKADDFVITADEFVNINPAPGEWVRIMEGKRHGFRNMTIGITYTQKGGGAPLHTHEEEEAHVLVKGEAVRYQLGDEVFVVKAPYVINIPPMVPHAFVNLSDDPFEMVVIFPTNEWEADFVHHPNAQQFFTVP